MSLYLYIFLSLILYGSSLPPLIISPPVTMPHKTEWLMLGDSITQQLGTISPNVLNQGMHGVMSKHAVIHIQEWLQLHKNSEVVALNFGTNDVVYTNCDTMRLYTNLIFTVNMVHRSNKIAVIPTIPTPLWKCTDIFNMYIRHMHEIMPSTKGPDLHALVAQNKQYVGADHIHLTEQGSIALRSEWIKFIEEYSHKLK